MTQSNQVTTVLQTLLGPLFVFGLPFAWTTFFSLFSKRPVRGFRNFGIIASYLAVLVSLWKFGWQATLLAWVTLGLSSGALYFTYELVSYWRARPKSESTPSASTVLHGLVGWPVMGPEAIEYILSAAGILKSTAPSSAPKAPDGESSQEESGEPSPRRDDVAP